MKTTLKRSTVQLLVLLVLAISVVVVATSIAPSTAQARTRLENTGPFAGDPDGPDQGTQSSPTKASGLWRSGTTVADASASVRNGSTSLAYWKVQLLVRFLLLARQI